MKNIKRLPTILLPIGIAFLLIAAFVSFSNHGTATPAFAALPDGHPTVFESSGAIVPTTANDFFLPITTTANDFFLPGTQPNNIVDEIQAPLNCTYCHGDGYGEFVDPPMDYESETWTAWSGSMMAQAGRDPLFYAALEIANADAEFAGEFCLRCHVPRGWLEGRSSDPTGALMTPDDLEGVQCEVCHRMVDPFYTAENPNRDLTVLGELTATVNSIGTAQFIVDTEDYRRGPLNVTETLGFDPHQTLSLPPTLQSPFHRDSALCGTCHDIDNPVLSWDETSQSYQPNDLDTPPGEDEQLFPIERTYSEWLLSQYNTPGGVYAPEFGGNKEYVSTCQDCHMRDIDGVGGLFFGNPNPSRTNYPLHDMTGGNTWVPETIPLHPVFSATFTGSQTAENRLTALISGTLRAQYMLQNAAELSANVFPGSTQLVVSVTNQTGHKLPTGYPEGRRMWIQVEGYNENDVLIYTSGAYDFSTGELTMDPNLKVYESKQGLTSDWASQLGLPPGPSFHFVLNNVVIKDNRIPPRGFAFDAFEAAGAAPISNSMSDPSLYADGQFWDITTYNLPEGVAWGVVRLYYQTASKEYIEFLRDNNQNPGNNSGNIIYDLWEMTNRSAPELMAEVTFIADPNGMFLPVMNR